MMIECPRCGFAQPKDQYCASCGVNMDQLLAKPKPFMVRLLQNPNFHLSLIAVLIVLVIGWIFYTQSARVSREVGRMLDLPVSSRNAGDPNDSEADNAAAAQAVADESAGDDDSEEAEAAPATAASGAVAGGDTRSPEEILAAAVGAPPPQAKGAAPPAQKLEMNALEVPRETLAALIPNAQRLSEGTGGRAYYFPPGSKAAETFQTTGQPLGPAKSANLAANAQISTLTPATAPEMFQFSFLIQVTKTDARETAFRYAVNFVLPQPEPPGQTGPAMRQVMEGNLSGIATLAPQGVVVLLLDPPNRAPRDEYLVKAGYGPWTVFSSPEFRSGLTDWVLVLQLK